MDRAIFQFDENRYDGNEVGQLSRKACEHLSNCDEEHVTKFNIDTPEELASLLNNDMFMTKQSWYKVFF